MRGGEYNASSVLHLTLILRGNNEHSASLCMSALTLPRCIIYAYALHVHMGVYIMCQNSTVNSTISRSISKGSVGKRERSRQRQHGYYFYQFKSHNCSQLRTCELSC